MAGVYEARKGSPAPEVRNALRPFAKMYRELYAAVDGLSDEDLATLDGKVGAFTSTNCGWDEYAVIRIIAPLVSGERRRRKQKGS